MTTTSPSERVANAVGQQKHGRALGGRQPATRRANSDGGELTLLTGFPGFRATYLVEALARAGQGVLLVVPESAQQVALELRQELGEAGARVEILTSDPWKIDFGLSGARYRELAKRVTRIHHLGRRLGDGGSEAHARRLNVATFREVLEFASLCSELRLVMLHSDVAVSGDREGVVLESELSHGQRFVGPGPLSLAIAEKMARVRMPRLPIAVVRSGQVVGRTFAGARPDPFGVHFLILLILHSPQELLTLLPGQGDAALHVLPVEAWLKAVLLLQEQAKAIGETVHLTDPDPLTLRDVFHRAIDAKATLVREGYGIPSLGRILSEDGSLRQRLQAVLLRPRAFLQMAFRNVAYDTKNALRILDVEGYRCPSLSEYFSEVVAQALRLSAPEEGRVVKLLAGAGA